MAKRTKKKEQTETAIKTDNVSLALKLAKRPTSAVFKLWLVGDTPLIVHAWSEKAKREMLSKQVKAPRGGREARNPEEDFLSSLYEMGEGSGVYGFPVTAFKKSFLTVAHKEKGVPKTDVMQAVFLDAEIVSVRPALAGAVCDMPLVRVWGSEPQMREDMVKIGKGLNKTASLAYRGTFRRWAVRITGKLRTNTVSVENFAALIDDAGIACGVGEWRNEKLGTFGSFHRATVEEEMAWEKFAAGKGPLPVSIDPYAEAAE